MDGARALDGYPRPTRYGLANLLMSKVEEGWRILIWHNMELAGRLHGTRDLRLTKEPGRSRSRMALWAG